MIMKTTQSKWLTALLVCGSLVMGASAFGAVGTYTDIGAVETTDKGNAQFIWTSPADLNVTWPTSTVQDPAVTILPDNPVLLDKFQWKQVNLTSTFDWTQAAVDAGEPDAWGFGEAGYSTLPTYTLTQSAAAPVFVTNGAWQTFSGTVNVGASQTFQIVPQVGADATTPDATLTSAIATAITDGSTGKYTYAEATTVAGFSVNDAGLVTVTSASYGTYTVNVALTEEVGKWDAIATPQAVTVTINPITITAINFTPPGSLVYSGTEKTYSAMGTYDTTEEVALIVTNDNPAINVGTYTATASAPAGYVFDVTITEEQKEQDFTITPYPTTWAGTSVDLPPSFIFGDEVLYTGGSFTAAGLNGDAFAATQELNYTQWTSTEAAVTFDPTFTPGLEGSIAGNYDVTGAPVVVPVTATLRTLAFTPSTVSVAVGADAALTAPTVVTTGWTGTFTAFEAAVNGTTWTSFAPTANFTTDGTNVTGVNVAAGDALTANFPGIANQAEALTGATYATVTVTAGTWPTDLKVQIAGTDYSTPIAYDGTAKEVTIGSAPAGTEVTINGTAETSITHAGTYAINATNPNYTGDLYAAAQDVVISPVAITLAIDNPASATSFGKETVPAAMSWSGMVGSDNFDPVNAATADYTAWTTAVGTGIFNYTSVAPTAMTAGSTGLITDYTFTPTVALPGNVEKSTVTIAGLTTPMDEQLNAATVTLVPTVDLSSFVSAGAPAITFSGATADDTIVPVTGTNNLTLNFIAVGGPIDVTVTGASGLDAANFEVTPFVIAVTVTDAPFATGIIYLSNAGNGDGAFVTPANISRFTAAMTAVGVTEIRIMSDVAAFTANIDFSSAVGTLTKVSAGWTAADAQGASAPVVTGAVTFATDKTLAKMIVVGAFNAPTVGTAEKCTFIVSAPVALNGIAMSNSVISGDAVTVTSGTLANCAFETATEGIYGTAVAGATASFWIAPESASNFFSPKFNGTYVPQPGSVLLNRGSATLVE